MNITVGPIDLSRLEIFDMAEPKLTFTPARTLTDAEYQEAADRTASINLDLKGDSGEAHTLWQQWRIKHPEEK